MSSTSLFTDSVQLLAILAAEVILVWAVVALMARRARSTSWRRVFWQGAILAMLGLTVFEVSGTARGVAGWARQHLSWQARDNSRRAGQSQQPRPRLSTEFRSQVEARLAAKREAQPPVSIPVSAHITEPAATAAGPDLSVGLATPVSTVDQTSHVHPPSPAFIFLWLSWVVGTLLLVGRAILGRCLLSLFHLKRAEVADRALRSRVTQLSHALAFCRRVHLVESARLRTPVAFGLFRPTIGLPAGFATRYTPERQEAMLTHELAHLAGRDPVWLFLADLAVAMLWWHPIAWWVRREFRLASELAADEASLVLQDGPAVLAECLLEMGALLANHRELGQLRVSGFRSHLGRRIQRLVHLEGSGWSPAPRRRAGLLLVFVPLSLAALVVLCTAWAAPQAQLNGNAMQPIQLTLKRSLATLALLAAVSTAETAAPAAEPATVLPQPGAPVGPTPPALAMPGTGMPGANDVTSAFRRRYGLEPAAALVPATSPKRQKIETKLDELMLPEIQFDGLPLSEVISILSTQSVKLDREKKGINFLINNNNPPTPPGMTIDPATGLPTPAPTEAIDVNSVSVKFSLPLRNVSLKDTLDAVVKVAERQLEYTVEDYGVVLSLKPEVKAFGQSYLPTANPTTSQPLVAATFKVDTNTFLAGLETAFDIKVAQPPAAKERAREIQSALRSLLTQLGVSGADAKSIFYNELTGIIMVRATASEQPIIQAAMETLGGTAVGSYGGDNGFSLNGMAGGGR